MPEQEDLMQKITSLAKRRGFIFPGSEIYGGLANSWDYGPLGVELKNNIKQEWWCMFVQSRSDMYGIDPAIIMSPKVWEASVHVGEFTDPLIECKICHERIRTDQEDKIEEHEATHKGEKIAWSEPKKFNLLFKTFMGTVEDAKTTVYLRGEIAQAMFVDFQAVVQTMRPGLPFGIAAQGRAFRNEITPGNFTFRTREFDLMEFEYFIRPEEWERHFEYWQNKMRDWLKHLGVGLSHIHEMEIPEEERAFYSKRTIDFEYDYPFGQKELYGLAYRTDYDLKNHQEKSGQDMQYTDPKTGEKFLPHVIEPSFGLDRSILAAMLEAYHEEKAPTAEEGGTDTRVVMKFPHWMAPIKGAVLPLSKKEELSSVAKKIAGDLQKYFVIEY